MYFLSQTQFLLISLKLYLINVKFNEAKWTWLARGGKEIITLVVFYKLF